MLESIANPVVAPLALAAVAALCGPWAAQRLALARAKHRSLAGHARIARRVAAWVPGYAYDEQRFFAADGAPADAQQRRRAGFAALAARLNARHAKTIALTEQARDAISDLQFTSAYRVPFPFSPYLRRHVTLGAFYARSDGVLLTDLDGQIFYDLTGSYGVTCSATSSTSSASPKARGASRRSARCSAATTRRWRGTWRSCAASPARTR